MNKKSKLYSGFYLTMAVVAGILSIVGVVLCGSLIAYSATHTHAFGCVVGALGFIGSCICGACSTISIKMGWKMVQESSQHEAN